MAFRLIKKSDEPDVDPNIPLSAPSQAPVSLDNRNEPSALRQKVLQKGKDVGTFSEGIAHAGATAAADVYSTVLGTPGNLFSFFNEVAGPASELITGNKALPFEKTYIGKVLPTSSQIEKSLHSYAPYLKPRNEYEKFSNGLFSTAALMLMPGGQAKTGLLPKMAAGTRAFIKSLGVNLFGKGTESFTKDPEKGEFAKMGALFLTGVVDQKSAGQFIGSIYNQAKGALKNAGNPAVNANRLTGSLQRMRSTLTTGTLAPSEAAVVQDIDKVLEHVQNGTIKVENLWGSLRSVNERKTEAVRSAAGRQGRSRARNFYGGLTRILNNEIEDYGKKNPAFGQPFKEAQTAFRVQEESNLVAKAVDSLTGKNIHNSGLLHLFGGAVAGAGALTKSLSPVTLLGTGAYQAGKILYRMTKSPALRKYYMSAIKNASTSNLTQFGKEVEKMDKILEKEDKQKKPYRIIKRHQD